MNRPAVSTRLRELPPRQGTQWVRLGVRTLLRRPAPLAGLFSAFLVAGVLIEAMPLPVQLAMLALVPLASLLFMSAARAVAAVQGGPLSAALREPLRGDARQRRALAALGGAYMIGCVAIMLIGGWLDGGALAELMQAMRRGGDPADVAQKAGDPRVAFGVLLRLALAALLSVPFWHAPALVHWAGQGAGQALFSSTIAVWRNRGAFTLYGLAWLWVMILASLLSAVVFGLFGLGQSIAVPLLPSLFVGSAFYVSTYFTFADCFEFSGPGAPVHPTPPPQQPS